MTTHVVLLSDDARERDVEEQLRALGQWTTLAVGLQGKAIVLLPGSAALDPDLLRTSSGVADVLVVESGHPLLDACQGKPVTLGEVSVQAGEPPVLMAGPCAVESAGGS